VSPSTLTAVATAPSTPTEVWTPHALARPDWGQPIEITTSWRTSIFTADDGSETRRGLYDRPLRSIRYQARAWSITDVAELRVAIERTAEARRLVPLWPDAVPLTSAVVATDTALPVVTTDRRFTAGARVVLLSRSSLVSTAFELATVSAVAAAELTVAAISGDWPAGTLVVPLLEAEPAFAGGAGWLTDRHADAEVAAAEWNGPQALDPLADLDAWPAAWQTHESLPILDLRSTTGQAAAELSAEGDLLEVGRTTMPTRSSGRPRWAWDLEYTATTRAQWAALAGLFDAARGSLRSFWWVEPVSAYQATSVGISSVTVTRTAETLDYDRRPFLAVIETDGTIHIREISSVSRGATTDQLLLVDDLPSIAAADVWRVTVAHRCRFSSDVLRETWLTDQTCVMRPGLVDVTAAGSITINDLSAPASTAGETAAAPLAMDDACVTELETIDAELHYLADDFNPTTQVWPNRGTAGSAWDLDDLVETVSGSDSPGFVSTTHQGRAAVVMPNRQNSQSWLLRAEGPAFGSGVNSKAHTIAFVLYQAGLQSGTGNAASNPPNQVEWRDTGSAAEGFLQPYRYDARVQARMDSTASRAFWNYPGDFPVGYQPEDWFAIAISQSDNASDPTRFVMRSSSGPSVLATSYTGIGTDRLDLLASEIATSPLRFFGWHRIVATSEYLDETAMGDLLDEMWA
jgi:hypothetical protein